MKALVTGGAGFLGSHLVDFLIDEVISIDEVVVLDNLSRGSMENVKSSEPKLVLGDLRDVEACKEAVKGVDVIYHLASMAAEGQSVFAPVYTFQVNVTGFLNLLVAAIQEGVETIIFTSSMAVFGSQPMIKWGFTENMPRKPDDPYGVSKMAVERLLEIYSKDFGFNYVIIRPHNVFGERQLLSNPYRNVVGIFINRVLQGKPPIIFGDGEQTRAFTYIDDCTPYLAKSAWTKEAYGEIINIGSEEVITINRLAEIVLEKTGRQDLKPVHRPERPMEVKHAWCSSEKAKRLLGYRTSTRVDEGVARMVEWAKQHGTQEFEYEVEEFEITKKIPQVWREREQ